MMSRLLPWACFIGFSLAAYTLEDDYLSGNFFDSFTFYTGSDPTDGFVQYVDQATAQSSGLIFQTDYVYIGTDSANVTPNGRPSVRITSNKSYNSGLFILELNHMPGGICGTWPAFWTVGPNWPDLGEIDIIEGVNKGTTNAMTLHTAEGCMITNNGAFTGSISTSDCWVNDPDQSGNAGCSIDTADTSTYGQDFNNIGGGIYAMEFTTTAISVWFFPRGAFPADVEGGAPNPDNWGEPMAQFQGGCNIPEFINDQQIVFDLTFCGDWAGAVWASSSCAALASSCDAFVENNPSAFAEAYWSINSLLVYQDSSNGLVSPSAAASPTILHTTYYTNAWATEASASYSMTQA